MGTQTKVRQSQAELLRGLLLVHIDISEQGLTALLLFRGGDAIRKLKKYTPTKFIVPNSKNDKDTNNCSANCENSAVERK